MDPTLAVLCIAAVLLYLFNQVSFIPSPIRLWCTSVVALLAVAWSVAAFFGLLHRR